MKRKHYKTCLNCGYLDDNICVYYEKEIDVDSIDRKEDNECEHFYCDWLWIPEELK